MSKKINPTEKTFNKFGVSRQDMLAGGGMRRRCVSGLAQERDHRRHRVNVVRAGGEDPGHRRTEFGRYALLLGR